MNTEDQKVTAFLLPAEVAAHFKVHVETVREWVRQGRVKAIRTGRTIKITRSEVERLEKAGRI